MEWTQSDKEALVAFKETIDSDNIKIKQKIKKTLLNNRFIIHVLNNKELEEAEAEPDDYFGVNILDYYMISPTQHNVQNFICYETNYDELNRYNSTVKIMQVVFYILCEQKNIKDEDTGIARHDLLAALIQDQFNYTNMFGSKLKLVSDVCGVVDTNYAGRTLTFEQVTDNNVIKTINGTPRFANKIEGMYFEPVSDN